jgi:hypothetical protein
MVHVWVPAPALVALVTVMPIRSPPIVGVELLTRSVTDAPPGATVGVVDMKLLPCVMLRVEKEAFVNVPAGAVSVIVLGKTRLFVALNASS